MKIKVSKKQFKILLNNFELIGDKGLGIEMSGEAFKNIVPDENELNEQKAYKVDMWVGSFPIKVIIFSGNSVTARMAAGKLFPKARVNFASEIKGNL
jgi:hypothetical protein